jgi:membrane-bound metal-dependent hydrolase YbcI (DUF457 family)
LPFTPYHFGPSGFLGLVLRRWIDLPMFLLANVNVDVEVLFATGYPQHQHWHLHTFLIGGLVGAICGAVVYFARPLRMIFKLGMRILHISYRPRLWKMVLSGMAGVLMHVFIDSFYHRDVQLLWPREDNPIFNFMHSRQLRITHEQIEMICLAFFVPAAILYALAVWSFLRAKKTNAAN